MKSPKNHIPYTSTQFKHLKPAFSSSTSITHLSCLQSSYASNLSKRLRSEKACDICRRRKVRCELLQDGRACRQCLQTKGECTFTTRPRRRGPRGVVQLEERLKRLERLLEDRVQREQQEQNSIHGAAQQNNGPNQAEINRQWTSVGYSRPRHIINGINNWIYRMCGIDKETSDALVNIYFAYVYSVIPVVDKASFLKQYRDQVDVLPSPPLLCAIYGAAVRFVESSKAFGYHTKAPLLNITGQRTSDAWSQRLMEYVKCNPSPNLPAIQSLVISVYHRSSSHSKWTDVWLLNSVAVRMAQDIGLHRNDQDAYLSENDKETRKRLWGLLYILDRWFSAGTGRPLAVFDDDCDEAYPRPIHVDNLVTKSVNIAPSSTDSTAISSSTLDIMNHSQLPLFETVSQLAKISKILGNILHELYTPMARKQWMESKSTDVVGPLEESIGAWRRNLPPFLQIKGAMVNWNHCNNEPLAILSGAIGLSYYTSLILLHRPFIQTESSPSSRLSLQICTNAAIRTVDIIGKLQSRDHLLVIWSFIIYPVFVSSLIHIYNANSSNSMVADVAKANLLRILTTLQLFGKLSPLAQKLHTALYHVAQHRQYLPHHHGSIATPPCSHQPKSPHECTSQPFSTSNHTNPSTATPDSVLSSVPSSPDYCNNIMDWINSKCTPLPLSDYDNSDHPFDMCSLFELAYTDNFCRRPASHPFTTLPAPDESYPATDTNRFTRLYEDFQLYSSQRESTTPPPPPPPTTTTSLKRSFYPGNIFWDLPSGLELNEWPTHPETPPVL